MRRGLRIDPHAADRIDHTAVVDRRGGLRATFVVVVHVTVMMAVAHRHVSGRVRPFTSSRRDLYTLSRYFKDARRGYVTALGRTRL